jgi:putative hydrolase of the HAD superfamily
VIGKPLKVCRTVDQEGGHMIDLVAFDADDTLWHNETIYHSAQSKYKDLLSKYQHPEWIGARLFETEMRNLDHFGYGIKAFTLSMIETAIELTEGRIQGSEIQQILELGKEMLSVEIKPLELVEETLAKLVDSHDLMLITKGDLLDQQSKIIRSGLGDYFTYIEIVSHKNRDTYRAILDKYRIHPSRFVMVGNSLKSDILPVVELGGQGVYIAYQLTWAHESIMSEDLNGIRYHQIDHISQLPDLIARIDQHG